MEKNERNYCTGILRHINIRFYFQGKSIQRRIENLVLFNKNGFCKLFYKPLKGRVFKIFRYVILGYKTISSLE